MSAASRSERLAQLQHDRPWAFVLVAFFLAAAATPLVLQLDLNSDFQAMLPESSRSVHDLDEIRRRFGGTATLTLAVQDTRGEGADIEAVRAFVRELVPRLEGREDLLIAAVDWNVADFETFVREHQHLYADLADLTEVRDSLQARLDYERARANPFYIDFGEEAPPDPEAVLERIRADAEAAEREMDRFPEGFYQHPDQPLILVFLRTSIRGGETTATDRLIAAVEAAADEVRGSAASRSRTTGTDVGWVHGDLRIDFGGDIMDVREENEALKEAVARSTIVTAALLVLAIFTFFFRVRAIWMLLLTLLPPCLCAFGIAEPIVDDLNASSAFLAAIVIGNGVNSSVMWLGRYFEERRLGKTVVHALTATHAGTWQGTLAAMIAAALAYGSLMVTDYRGFRDFGLIGALGMILCWLAAYLLLPALAVLSERARPMRFEGKAKEHKGFYGVLFARLALGSPRAVLAASFVLALVGLVGIGIAVQGDPLEYDFRNLQARRPVESRVQWVNDRVGETVEETRSGSALAILAARTEDVAPLRARLAAYADEHPGVMGPIRNIDDLLPADQEEKLPILVDLRRVLLEARPFLSPERQADIDAHIPPEVIETVTRDDLPESVARPFRERDGTLGRLIFVERAPAESGWDGRYMIRWSEAVRSAELPGSEPPPVAGAAVVFADLLETIFTDGPFVISVSFGLTLLLLLFSFRTQRDRVLALTSMLFGVVWMTGILALTGSKLNFLNMVAFPVTFGIGLEYSVNVVKRYREERVRDGATPESAIRATLEGAGGAVILCSLTTLIGYISLYASTNRALNSFGLAMSLGEVTTLAASVLSLPAFIWWLEARKATAAPAPKADSAS